MSHLTKKLTLNPIFYIICLFLVLFLVPLHKRTVMGTKEKLIERILSCPKDFTYDEAKRLFGIFGYKESNKGATSGSRVEFIGPDEEAPFILHKPHPGSILKSYVIKGIIEHIKKNNLIEKYKQSKTK